VEIVIHVRTDLTFDIFVRDTLFLGIPKTPVFVFWVIAGPGKGFPACQ
jgi:hypothetical protein